MKTSHRLVVAAFFLAAFDLSAATLYVSLESRNPVVPYSAWATAATNIQDAVDAARYGDTVLVTNGVYAVGSREASVWDTNRQPPQLVSVGMSRVVVTNTIRLVSVNGPSTATIQGGELTNALGDVVNRVRGVFLGNGAVLSGFTLTNGYTWGNGGGVYCGASGVVTNCNFRGNSAIHGGGVHGGILYNCTFTDNRADGPSMATPGGGGAYRSTLYHCTVTNNVGRNDGGGVTQCTLHNCTVVANRAVGGGDSNGDGGGASYSTLYDCTVAGNSAVIAGGGALRSTLYNCVVSGNGSGWMGGGVSGSTLFNCTVTGNLSFIGGGAFGDTLYNCILYYNNTTLEGENYFNGVMGWGEEISTLLQHCCTSPLPTNGIGNITGPPLFMDMAGGDFRLWEGSPCIDAGTNLTAFSFPVTNEWGEVSFVPYPDEPTDLLGNTRFIDGDGDGTVAWDMGAYEFNSFRPPRFSTPPQLTPYGWMLHLTGATNKWVYVQRSADLKNWENFWQPVFMGPAGSQQFTDGMTDQSRMFYRVYVP